MQSDLIAQFAAGRGRRLRAQEAQADFRHVQKAPRVRPEIEKIFPGALGKFDLSELLVQARDPMEQLRVAGLQGERFLQWNQSRSRRGTALQGLRLAHQLIQTRLHGRRISVRQDRSCLGRRLGLEGSGRLGGRNGRRRNRDCRLGGRRREARTEIDQDGNQLRHGSQTEQTRGYDECRAYRGFH